MVFDRFRRLPQDRAPGFAFYGKLPFDPEFLRFHVDSPEGRSIHAWVHGAHQRIAAQPDLGEARSDTELRAVIARDGGHSALAALIRPGTDGGGRSYPSCAFCVLPADDFRAAWHLSPLWLEPVWQSMAEHILGTTAANRVDFEEGLDLVPLQPAEAASVSSRFDDEVQAVIGHPWDVLTATSGAAARSLAVTFVQLARVQREAQGGSASIAVRIPLKAAGEPALQAAVWMRLFSAISAFKSPWPAAIEVHRKSEPQARNVCIFGREPTPADLAFLLSGQGSAAIDDLNDTWEAEPEGDTDRRNLELLIDETPRCLADLWQQAG